MAENTVNNMDKSGKRRKSSVMARRIVTLCLSLVLTISIVITVVTLVNITKVTNKNLYSKAELTMRYINLDIRNAILPSIDLTNSVGAIVPRIEFEELENVLAELLPTVPGVFEIYYGTAVSRFDGGRFATATDWDPYGDNPQWDQVRRPWFITAMQNPDRVVITDPYEDASTGET